MTIKTVKLGKVGFSRLNIDKLLELERETGIRYVTQVGILGDKAARFNTDQKTGTAATSESLTNAELGLIQERGSISRHIPARSFLQMPLFLKLDKNLSSLKKLILRGIEVGDLRIAYRDLGILAENIVQQAFGSGGFGHWLPNKPSTIARKKSSQPLIDTGQLRRSISSRVVKK